jgi:prepilin signal peptidase PulO-like enzyme (type II secretory pathway)
MLMYTALLMMMCSIILELTLVSNFPWLQKAMERYIFLAVLFSLFLSWFLGIMFGATGLIIITAGTGSTVLTSLVYKWKVIDKTREADRKMKAASARVNRIIHPKKKFITVETA